MKLPKIKLRAPAGLENDRARDGWTLVGNANCTGTEELELAGFLHQGESRVDGNEMVRRAKELGNQAGQLHAELLLRQRDEIPKEWQRFYLVFPGTTWRLPNGGLHVPYLYWCGRWYLDWDWLGYNWGGGGRLVRVCK
jgi:hypothetical protein